MKFDSNRLAVAVLCSTLLLSGCLKNENGDAVPPTSETPGDNPETDPNPDDGSGDPDNGAPDEGGDPIGPDDPDPEGPIDGEQATPYAEGIAVYRVMDSSGVNTDLIREFREINGNTLTYNLQEKESSSAPWASSDPESPWMLLSENSSSASFIEMKPEQYTLDTAAYTLAVDATPYSAILSHSYYDATGQGIKDFVAVNVEAPNLANSLDPSPTFDGGAQVFRETISLQAPIVAYYPGPSSGASCLDYSGAVLPETITASQNCNLLIDQSGNAYSSFGDMIGADISTAPIVAPNTLFETELKFVADDDDLAFGSIITAGNSTEVGRFAREAFLDGTVYYQLSGTNLGSLNFYDEEDVPWDSIQSYYLLLDGQRIRVGVKVAANAVIKKDNYLINQDGMSQVESAFSW